MFSNETSVFAVLTGLAADYPINCYQSYDTGSAVVTAINGKAFSKVKLKCGIKVKTVSSSTNTVKIHGQSVSVIPALLFNRIIWILKSSSGMENSWLMNWYHN